MDKKTIGMLVCMLLVAAAVLPVVGIKNDYKTTDVVEGILQDKSIIETEMQGMLEADFDWEIIGNNVVTSHGDGYPTGNVGIGTTSPGCELEIENADYITAIKLVETTGIDSVWELQAINDEGMGQNQFAIYGGEEGSEEYRLVISPNSAISMGYGTTASDYNAMAMGGFTTASGHTSTAMGYNTIASGTGSTAMGYDTIASGDGSTAMGSDTVAWGDYSTAMGNSIRVDGDYSVGIGLLDLQDPFIVTPDNVMSIMGGNVGIGSTAPSYLLDVDGGSGIVAQFSGRVKGAPAVNNNEFVTKGQVKSVVTTHFTPTGTSDKSGAVGDTAWDDNYFYVKTPDGWKRAALETWETTPLQTHTTLNTEQS